MAGRPRTRLAQMIVLGMLELLYLEGPASLLQLLHDVGYGGTRPLTPIEQDARRMALRQMRQLVHVDDAGIAHPLGVFNGGAKAAR